MTRAEVPILAVLGFALVLAPLGTGVTLAQQVTPQAVSPSDLAAQREQSGTISTVDGTDGASGAAVASDGTIYFMRQLQDETASETTFQITVLQISMDGGPPAALVTVRSPFFRTYSEGLKVTPDGDLLLAVRFKHQVLRIAPDGRTTVAAGSTFGLNTGDGDLATSAQLSEPGGVAVGPDGTFYVASAARGWP